MMDPGFAILTDLVAVREHIDYGRIDLAKIALKRATWAFLNRWCDEAERDCSLDSEPSASHRTIDAADATADTSPCMSDLTSGAPCGEDVAVTTTVTDVTKE